MTEDLTDAKRDDAADLLQTVTKHGKEARRQIRPGMPELLMLLAGWSWGRLTSVLTEHDSFVRTLLVLGAVVLLLDASAWVHRRDDLGTGVSTPTWFIAGFIFSVSAITGYAAHGDARQLMLALELVGACALIGALHRSALLLIFAGVMAILTATQIWPLVVMVPMCIGSLELGGWIMTKVMEPK
jgi:hypothetical protein